jgi:hypothetical protein
LGKQGNGKIQGSIVEVLRSLESWLSVLLRNRKKLLARRVKGAVAIARGVVAIARGVMAIAVKVAIKDGKGDAVKVGAMAKRESHPCLRL